MLEYYTNVAKFGKHILYRGVKDGSRVKYKTQYAPILFVPSKNDTGWKTLNNENVEPMRFDTMKEASDFVKGYEGVSNFKIYGNQNYSYSYIAENFKNQIEWDIEHLAIDVIDIETGSENGFPDPRQAPEPVTAITITRFGKNPIVFGCGDYKVKGEEKYIKCSNEIDLLEKFLFQFEYNCPDVITGWNIKFFDIPYLYNRIMILLGEEQVKRLSPWGFVKEKTSFQRGTGKEIQSYEIVGVAQLDYLELYRTFSPHGNSQENYRLDNIATVEIGEKKVSYEEYGNLHQLYKLNYQLFIEYNIKDVDLVIKLEGKLKLIELALTLAYDTKSNFEDVFTQTRMWDALIYSYLLNKKIVIPPKYIQEKDSAFEGAYVKDPQVGLHFYVASFDLNSLYPHLMMQYNISPEMLVEPSDYTDEMKRIIMDGVSVDKLLEKKVDLSGLSGVTLTPNGQFFRTDKKGFLPEMLEGMYNDRKKFKKMMLGFQQQYENETDEEIKKDLTKKIARYNNLQLAKKVGLNSAYGAMGTVYFRFFDIRLALAVTQTGQLSIRWIENKLNAYMNKLLGTNEDYVIASDTDSIYLSLEALVNRVYKEKPEVNKIIKFMDKACEEKIQPYITKSYQELADYIHAFDQKMFMKREALCDRGIWTAKKRYILNVYNNEGVQYKEPKLKVMGLEMVKSSTPLVVRDKMKELIKIIVTKNESDVHDFIVDFKKEFKKLPPEEISFPRSVNGLKKYSDSATMYKSGTPIHVKGSILYNHQLKLQGLDKKYPKIQEGEKIKFTYLRMPNLFKSPVISYPMSLPKEFNLHNSIDYEAQFQKTFIDPISVILECIGWNTEKKSTLDSFFS
jgi:DNA polymerase elongation subunit (family B)